MKVRRIHLSKNQFLVVSGPDMGAKHVDALHDILAAVFAAMNVDLNFLVLSSENPVDTDDGEGAKATIPSHKNEVPKDPDVVLD